MESLYYAFDTLSADGSGELMRSVLDGLGVFITPAGWTLPPLIDSLPSYFDAFGTWIGESIWINPL